MSNQLAVREDMPLAQLGQVLAQSGFFEDSKDANKAIVKVLAGREMGFSPIASMTGISIIKGRVAVGANLIASAIKRSGRYDYRVRELTDKVCRIEFFEGVKSAGVSEFSEADAQKAGTQNMGKFPRNMLFARAISNGAKWYCPDIFGGPIYTPDELGATVNEDGEVVEQTQQRQAAFEAAQKVISEVEREVKQAQQTSQQAEPTALAKRYDALVSDAKELNVSYVHLGLFAQEADYRREGPALKQAICAAAIEIVPGDEASQMNNDQLIARAIELIRASKGQ